MVASHGLYVCQRQLQDAAQISQRPLGGSSTAPKMVVMISHVPLHMLAQSCPCQGNCCCMHLRLHAFTASPQKPMNMCPSMHPLSLIQAWLDHARVLVGTKCNTLLSVNTLHNTHVTVNLPPIPATRTGPDLLRNPHGQCGIHAISVSPGNGFVATGGRCPEDAVVLRAGSLTPVQTFVVGSTCTCAQWSAGTFVLDLLDVDLIMNSDIYLFVVVALAHNQHFPSCVPCLLSIALTLTLWLQQLLLRG